MAAVEVILLQRVDKLGQMGDVVRVKPGFARNFLLPQKKAMRASKDNRERFEQQRAQLEAQNLRRREEAERLAERVGGLSVVIIRQAGEIGRALRLGFVARHRGSGDRRRPHRSVATRSPSNIRSSRWGSRGCGRSCTPRSRSRSR